LIFEQDIFGGLNVQHEKTAVKLENTVGAARTWLLELDEATVRHRLGSDGWSIAEVIGHLDSACNNHQRFIRAQEECELAFPKYEQRSWVDKSGYANADWQLLLELWNLYNLQMARIIRGIPEQKLSTPCKIGDNEVCTLGFLVTDYVDHLVHHLARIQERVFASGE
jgi:hypothetical protein